MGRAGGEFGAASPQGEAPTHPDWQKQNRYVISTYIKLKNGNILIIGNVPNTIYISPVKVKYKIQGKKLLKL